MDYLSEIIEVLENNLSVSVNEDSTSSNTENWDSLAQMRIILGIEDRFDIEVSDEDIWSLTSAIAIDSYIQEKKSNA